MSRPASASTTSRPLSSRAQRTSTVGGGGATDVTGPRPPTTGGASSEALRTPRPPTSKASTLGNARALYRSTVPTKDEDEREDALAHIAEFEALLQHHLVYTLPSTQKQRCTEHVVNATTAVTKAAAAVRDMHSIGLSGLRLIGDFEHEYQFPRPHATADGVAHRGSSGSARGASAVGGGSKGSSPRGTGGPLCASSVDVAMTLAPDATHTREQQRTYAVPTLEELRLPLPVQRGREDGSASVSTPRQPATRAPHETTSCCSTPRPVSARVYPPVRQVRMFTAPLYPDIPVAPHLTAIMKWCRNADWLCKDRYLQHCLVIAAQTTEDADQQFQRHVGWSDGGNGFVAAAVVPATHAGKHKSMTSIIRESRYAVRILQEATHGLFEDHLNRYNALVAVWFEYCNKDVTTPKTQFRIPGCMGSSASKFTAFFETVFASVFTSPRDSEALYKLLNDDCLEQLTFGRCFFLLYLALGVHTTPALAPDGGGGSTDVTGVQPHYNSGRRKEPPRPSMVGADIALNNTLFASTVQDITPFHMGRANTSASASTAGVNPIASLCEMWFSWAGVTLKRACRTINAFHLESLVSTVVGLFATEGSSVPHTSASAVALKRVADDLKADVASFRLALGTRIEVMLDEGLSLLSLHTKILGQWLTSSKATEAQDELNAMAEHVIRSIEEEDRAERQRDAMRQALVAASPPPKKKRALGRSSSLSMPRRKPTESAALPRKLSLI